MVGNQDPLRGIPGFAAHFAKVMVGEGHEKEDDEVFALQEVF